MSSRWRQQGLSLIELIMTIVILGIALMGVTFMLQNSLGRSAEPLLQLRTVSLAQAYLDEILGKRFDENSHNSGIPPCRASAPPPRQCTAEGSFGANYSSPVESGENSRSKLDDVDDYHGMDEGFGQLIPLQDAEGNTRTGYDNFRVQVNVRYINVGAAEEEENLGVNNELDDQYDAKLITVTVTHTNLAQGYDYSAYKANF